MRLRPWEGDPGLPAVWTAHHTWSRGQVAAAAAAGAGVLEAHGVAAGAACATLLRPGIEGLTGLASAWASPGAVAPLSPRLTPVELAAALRLLRPAVVVVESATERSILAALREIPIHLRPAILTSGGVPGHGDAEPVLHPLTTGSVAPGEGLPPEAKLVMWTSGTTGAPRAIVLGGGGAVDAAGHQLSHMGVQAGDHLPLTLPLSTIGGLMTLLRTALGRGVAIPLARFDEADVVHLLRTGRVQHLSLVPVMLRRVLDCLEGGEPLSDAVPLRTVLVGGAPCPAPLVERAVAAGLPVALTWGMTESCAQAVTATPAETRVDHASVGRPLEHVTLRVGRTGRLALRVAGLEPAELVRDGNGDPHLRSLVDEDGWLVTSDLGEVSPEGTLRITGRVSDRIISGGVNVDPMEVERHLQRHPGVAEVAVVGTPDAHWGERVTAVVVPRAAAAGSAEELPAGALPGELEAHARSGLSPAKRPRSWVWVVALPRNAAGKVDRDALRRLAASADDA